MQIRTQSFKGNKKKPTILLGSVTDHFGSEVGNIILIDKTARFFYLKEAESYFHSLIEEYKDKGYEILGITSSEEQYLH